MRTMRIVRLALWEATVRGVWLRRAVAVFPTVLLGALVLAPGACRGAVLYSSPGATYTQDFDTLASIGSANPWANDSTVPGWYWVRSTGTTPSTYTAVSGTPAQDQILSLGSAGSSERALGSQSPDTSVALRYGVQIVNDTGMTLTNFALSYHGEQWRVVINDLQDALRFDYQIFPAGTGSLTAATGWTSVSSLDFIAPITTTGSSTPLDGNLAANSAWLSAVVSGLSWTAGSELWLRWSDGGYSGGNRRQMMGIDDISFTVLPEPSTMALLMLGTLGLAAWSRRRQISLSRGSSTTWKHRLDVVSDVGGDRRAAPGGRPVLPSSSCWW